MEGDQARERALMEEILEGLTKVQAGLTEVQAGLSNVQVGLRELKDSCNYRAREIKSVLSMLVVPDMDIPLREEEEGDDSIVDDFGLNKIESQHLIFNPISIVGNAITKMNKRPSSILMMNEQLNFYLKLPSAGLIFGDGFNRVVEKKQFDVIIFGSLVELQGWPPPASSFLSKFQFPLQFIFAIGSNYKDDAPILFDKKSTRDIQYGNKELINFSFLVEALSLYGAALDNSNYGSQRKLMVTTVRWDPGLCICYVFKFLQQLYYSWSSLAIRYSGQGINEVYACLGVMYLISGLDANWECFHEALYDHYCRKANLHVELVICRLNPDIISICSSCGCILFFDSPDDITIPASCLLGLKILIGLDSVYGTSRRPKFLGASKWTLSFHIVFWVRKMLASSSMAGSVAQGSDCGDGSNVKHQQGTIGLREDRQCSNWILHMVAYVGSQVFVIWGIIRLWVGHPKSRCTHYTHKYNETLCTAEDSAEIMLPEACDYARAFYLHYLLPESSVTWDRAEFKSVSIIFEKRITEIFIQGNDPRYFSSPKLLYCYCYIRDKAMHTLPMSQSLKECYNISKRVAAVYIGVFSLEIFSELELRSVIRKSFMAFCVSATLPEKSISSNGDGILNGRCVSVLNWRGCNNCRSYTSTHTVTREDDYDQVITQGIFTLLKGHNVDMSVQGPGWESRDVPSQILQWVSMHISWGSQATLLQEIISQYLFHNRSQLSSCEHDSYVGRCITAIHVQKYINGSLGLLQAILHDKEHIAPSLVTWALLQRAVIVLEDRGLLCIASVGYYARGIFTRKLEHFCCPFMKSLLDHTETRIVTLLHEDEEMEFSVSHKEFWFPLTPCCIYFHPVLSKGKIFLDMFRLGNLMGVSYSSSEQNVELTLHSIPSTWCCTDKLRLVLVIDTWDFMVYLMGAALSDFGIISGIQGVKEEAHAEFSDVDGRGSILGFSTCLSLDCVGVPFPKVFTHLGVMGIWHIVTTGGVHLEHTNFRSMMIISSGRAAYNFCQGEGHILSAPMFDILVQCTNNGNTF